MITNLPAYISLIFGLTTVATLLLFYWTVKNASTETTRKKSGAILLGLTIWLVIQAVLTLKDVYSFSTAALPPKIMMLGIAPAILVILLLFLTRGGRRFVDSLPLANITYINIVRIPVELTLLWLCLYKAVPQLMTFEGRNFDIFSGITAPFIAYFGYTKGKLGKAVLLTWNFVCLALLANIVVNAFLSAPTPLQRFAFDQPNIAIVHFPFSWLPTFIVPVVLFGHLVSIRQLMKSR